MDWSCLAKASMSFFWTSLYAANPITVRLDIAMNLFSPRMSVNLCRVNEPMIIPITIIFSVLELTMDDLI